MKILLVTDEMLSEDLPVFTHNPQLPRFFVLDPSLIATEGWSLKRVQFIVDCLAYMPSVRVFYGNLGQVCINHRVTHIVTQQTPNHAICRWLQTLDPLTIEWWDEPAFVQYDGKLNRFSHYWKTVASQWFSNEELDTLALAFTTQGQGLTKRQHKRSKAHQ